MRLTGPSESHSPNPELDHQTELLEAAERVAHIGSWEYRPDVQAARWSANLYRIYGFEPLAVEPTLELIMERTHPADRERMDALARKAAEEGRIDPMEYRTVRPDGSVRHLRVEMVAEGEGSTRRLVGIVQDLTENRLAAREISAHAAVSEALARWESFSPGAEELLEALGAAMEFEAGAFWLAHDDTLAAEAVWSSRLALEPFADATRGAEFARGVGLAGRAWEAGGPVSCPGPDHEVDRARAEAAAAAGVHGGIAFPAIHGDETLAVLEFISTEDAPLGDRLRRTLTGIGYELGEFLARRRGELAPPPLTPRELEILQLAARGLSGPKIAEQLFVSPATVKTHFEHIYRKLDVSDRPEAVAIGLRLGIIE